MNVKRKQKRKKEREDAFLTSKAFYERMPRANKLNKRICLSHQFLTYSPRSRNLFKKLQNVCPVSRDDCDETSMAMFAG